MSSVRGQKRSHGLQLCARGTSTTDARGWWDRLGCATPQIARKAVGDPGTPAFWEAAGAMTMSNTLAKLKEIGRAIQSQSAFP